MLKQAQSNKDIREAAASAGVFLWQVAEAIGVTDGTFSRKLRRELPDDDKAAILQIIQQAISTAFLTHSSFKDGINPGNAKSISLIFIDVQNQQHLSINQVGIPL